MARSLEQLTVEAMELPEEERLALGEQLLSSVAIDPRNAESWEAEISRRIEEIKTGSVAGVPAEEVEAELRHLVS